MNRKTIKILVTVVVLLAVVVPTALFFRGFSQARETQPVVSAQARQGTISSAVSGAGTLAAQSAQTLTVPGGVKLTRFCVEAGDTVAAGDVLAVADHTSVALAMQTLQETMDELDEALEAARQEKGSETIAAAAAGRVKTIHAVPGETVAAVMYRDGALARISLDGKMAVEIGDSALAVGESVRVLRADGSELAGLVESAVDGQTVVTVTDDGTAYGEPVTVVDAAGAQRGSGTLYIHSELKVTGYVGTVKSVAAAENRRIGAGTALFYLTDTQELAEYTRLREERGELAEQQAELSRLYADGNIRAEYAGVVSQINEDMVTDDTAALLAAPESAAAVVLLGSANDWNDPGHYASSVALATGAAADCVSYVSLGGVSANTLGALDLSAAVLGGGGSLLYGLGVSAWYNGVELGSFGAIQSGRVLIISAGYNGNTDTSVFLTDTVAYRVSAAEGMSCSLALAAAGQDFSAALTGVTGELRVSVGGRAITGFQYAGGTLTIPAAEVNGDIVLSQASVTPTPDPSQGETGGSGTGSGQGSRPGGVAGITGGLGGFAFVTPAQEEATDFSRVDNGILVLTPNETMTVSIAVDELDVRALVPGQKVSITLDALTGQSFDGTVTAIAAEGSNSGGSSKYVTEITLPRTSQMLPGMNASVTILLAAHEDVLLLPVEALQEQGNRVFVYRAYDEKSDTLSDPVAVETGLSDGGHAQILSGLAPGDTVYYRYTAEADFPA